MTRRRKRRIKFPTIPSSSNPRRRIGVILTILTSLWFGGIVTAVESHAQDPGFRCRTTVSRLSVQASGALSVTGTNTCTGVIRHSITPAIQFWDVRRLRKDGWQTVTKATQSTSQYSRVKRTVRWNCGDVDADTKTIRLRGIATGMAVTDKGPGGASAMSQNEIKMRCEVG